ncbi:MAG TPA: sugar transferase, partial [Armatimonadota bacterium]
MAISERMTRTYAETWHPSWWYAPAKRLMDVTISSVALIAALPLLIPAALAVAIDSRGSVFYKRRVVGKSGKAFDALKIRTMLEDGDSIVTEDTSLVEELQNNHKLKEDPRITRVGRILRKTSIDELPQLINVLKGEMSLVGPRMISFPELEKFGEWQDKMLEVKPGITGLW